MRVLVSDDAAALVAERGGRLYVWPKKSRCCGGMTWLESDSSAPPGVEFRHVDECERVDLYFPAAIARPPDELHLEARRFPRRVEAYWNGCAWIA